MIPFDPFTSPIIRPSWYKKIKLYVAPSDDKLRVFGRTLVGTGKCCCWGGWNNNKDDPHGIVRVDGVRWYLHRYTFSKYHKIELSSGDVVDHICRRRLCFNPLHLECTDHHTNYERGDAALTQFKKADEYQPSDEDIEGLLG